MLEDEARVRAVLEDAASSALSDAEKALFAFVDKVNHASAQIGAEDIAPLHALGWSDQALYQAITVTAIFNFYNRWVDASGVRPMDEAAHRMHARGMAQTGYIRTTE